MSCVPMVSKLTFTTVYIFSLSTFASAKSSGKSPCFLDQNNAQKATLQPVTEDADTLVLDKLGHNWTQLVNDYESDLRTSLVALPKTAQGHFGQAAVRYALHRLFMQRYGWSFRGLEPDGEALNASSPISVLTTAIPADVHSYFEARISNGGLRSREIALLAAFFKNMTHGETQDRVKTAYQYRRMPTTGELNLEYITDILQLYMASYILTLHLDTLPREEIEQAIANIDFTYPVWNETKTFIAEKQASVAGGRAALSFADVVEIAQKVEDDFGMVQNLECKILKGKLLAMQEGGSGRVPLARFYETAITEEQWQFSESTAYLRQLGALDESDPDHLRVIMANWMNSRSNCLATSSSHSVCCQNECESLLSRLETQVQGPDATPRHIISLVEKMPSASTPVDRKIPSRLVQRLEEIADTHGGKVRLHGRLFAQWMHHSYPQECPYPHLSGTIAPLRPTDYESTADQGYAASDEEMLQFINIARMNAAKKKHLEEVVEDKDSGECADWHHVEELFVPWSEPAATVRSSESLSALQVVSAIAAACALAGVALIAVGAELPSVQRQPPSSYFV